MNNKSIKNIITLTVSYVVPALLAIALIPLTLKNMGNELYGIIAVYLVFIGYSSIFDAAIFKSLVYHLSLTRNSNKKNEFDFYYTSAKKLYSRIGVAVIVSAFIITILIQIWNPNANYLAIIPGGFSVYFILKQSLYSSVLEATENFKLLAIVKFAASSAIYIAPFLASLYTNNIVLIISCIAVMRMLIAALSKIFADRSYKNEFSGIIPKLDGDHLQNYIKSLWKYGKWTSISGVSSTLLNKSDVVVIAWIMGAGSAAVYSAISDLTTKLGVFAVAISTVAFPQMIKYKSLQNKDKSSPFRLSMRLTLLFYFPVVIVVLLHGDALLLMWLNENLNSNDIILLKIFTFGVFVHALGQPAYQWLQAHNKPRITAIIHLIEAGIYIVSSPIVVATMGYIGLACFWLARRVVSTALLHLIRIFDLKKTYRFKHK